MRPRRNRIVLFRNWLPLPATMLRIQEAVDPASAHHGPSRVGHGQLPCAPSAGVDALVWPGGRCQVAELLQVPDLTPHERRATLFNHRQAASSTLLHPAACTILLGAVRAWLRLCRTAASVFRFLFAFIASPRCLIHEVAHPHCSNHHGECSSFPCPHYFHQNNFSLNAQQSSWASLQRLGEEGSSPANARSL